MKNKIIEKLKSDKDLLYRTLRNELIDGSPFYRFIVFEDIDEDAKEVLEYNYPDFKTLLEERENKSCVGYYIFNEETNKIETFNNLDEALKGAMEHLEEIADYIIENYHPKFCWFEVVGDIELEDIEI